jgi:hypothetical protein
MLTFLLHKPLGVQPRKVKAEIYWESAPVTVEQVQLTIAAPKNRVKPIRQVCEVSTSSKPNRFRLASERSTWIVFGQETIQPQFRFDLGDVGESSRHPRGMRSKMRVDKEESMVRELQADSSGASAVVSHAAAVYVHAAFVAEPTAGKTRRHKVLVDTCA